jgi:CarboxypepD_reg-like domain
MANETSKIVSNDDMNKQPTTEQLRKYVAGQLSRAEQYAVERAALNDPFVADALDGLMASKNANNDLAELQSRLQKRVNPKENQRLGVWLWASAAALVLGIGLGWVYFKENEIIPAVSMAKTEEVGKSEVGDKLKVDIKPKKDELIAAVSEPNPTNTKPRPTTAITKAEDINASLADEVVVPAEENIAEAEIEKSAIKEDKMFPAAAPTMMKAANLARVDSSILKDIQPNQITVRGVIKAADGSALPGVSVNVKGENRGVNTDANGVFALDKIKTGDMLSFSYVGFNTKEITVKDSTIQQIILQEDKKVLSEVVVVSYDRKAKRAVKKAARKIKRAKKK